MSNTERVVDVGWLTLTRYGGTPWLVFMDRVEVVEPDGDGGSSLYFGSGIIRSFTETPEEIWDMLHPTTPACDDLVSDIDAALILLADEAGDGAAVVRRAIGGLERVRAAVLTHQ